MSLNELRRFQHFNLQTSYVYEDDMWVGWGLSQENEGKVMKEKFSNNQEIMTKSTGETFIVNSMLRCFLSCQKINKTIHELFSASSSSSSSFDSFTAGFSLAQLFSCSNFYSQFSLRYFFEILQSKQRGRGGFVQQQRGAELHLFILSDPHHLSTTAVIQVSENFTFFLTFSCDTRKSRI